MAAVVLLAAGALCACGSPKVRGPDSARPGRDAGAGGARADGAADGKGFALPDGGGAGAGGAGAGTGGTAGTGGPDRCAEQAYQAERVPLDLLLLVDTSGSMGQEVDGRPKWAMVNEALQAFVADPASAGLGVGLATFPPLQQARVCAADADCGGTALCTTRACVSPGGSPRGSLPCLAGLCLPGSSCVAVGRCSQSGAECAAGGRSCPGGAGDVCDTAVRTCRLRADTSCNVDRYSQPQVAIAALPPALGPLRDALGAVVPGGQTPMQPAVEGSLALLRAHVAENPGRRAALVLATDGLPEGCDNQSVDAIATNVAAGRAAAAVPTYVIGVFTADELPASQPALAALASAGGTGAPFILEPSQSLTQRFLDALNQIRGNALACEFQIPRPTAGVQDFGKVNVRFTTGAGATEDLVYVTSVDRCDPARGGWYYDVAPPAGTPQRIITCPASCGKFKADAGGRVEIRIGCTTRVD
jgi:Mg-chelatase subunit ChlD